MENFAWGVIIDNLLKFMGVKTSAFIAGTAGALVSVFVDRKQPPLVAVLMIMAGALSAGYVTPLFDHLAGHRLAAEFENVIAFFIGMTAMRGVRLLLLWIDRLALFGETVRDRVKRIEKNEKKIKEAEKLILMLTEKNEELRNKNLKENDKQD